MRLDQSSMDMSTLAHKVEKGEIDLQPDFQRGQVWPETKRKKLIDTILRGWYVPAVHLVVNDDLDVEEVLDGQQRLQSVLSFMKDEFPIDGSTEPSDASIQKLGGLRYSELPDQIRSRFRRYPITTIRLRDYNPDEPGELFFRLNQLTALTAAEQRNALVGEPRNQIKRLVEELTETVGEEAIGFTNSRMNYDDVLLRLAYALEVNQLSAKTTAVRLERRYRLNKPFNQEVVRQVATSIRTLAAVTKGRTTGPRLNKASLFSWLFFFVDNSVLYEDEDKLIATIYRSFEQHRGRDKITEYLLSDLHGGGDLGIDHAYQVMARIFNDRASSRVNDSTSILLRDMCMNVHAFFLTPPGVYDSRGLLDWMTELDQIGFELMHFPLGVSESINLEAGLASKWERHRATRQAG